MNSKAPFNVLVQHLDKGPWVFTSGSNQFMDRTEAIRFAKDQMKGNHAVKVQDVAGNMVFNSLKDKEHEFQNYPVRKQATDTIEEHVKASLIESIEKDVLEWLHTEEADSVLELKLLGEHDKLTETLLFSRSEIYIKTCANHWDVWRIATCCNWPNMISYRKTVVFSNSFPISSGDGRLENEIRSQNYSSSGRSPWGEPKIQC